jgi:hypothetical protein
VRWEDHDATRFFHTDGRVDFVDVPKKTAGFFTYHGFLTIASSSRIISLDYYVRQKDTFLAFSTHRTHLYMHLYSKKRARKNFHYLSYR